MQSYASLVTLDISCNAPVEVVKAKQLDSKTRTITVNFIDEAGEYYSISSGVTAEFRVKRPDGVLITDTTHNVIHTESSPNTVTVTLFDSMLEVPGRALADVRLISGDEIISGGSFFIDVYTTANGRDFTGYMGTNAPSTIMTRAQYEATTHSDTTVYIVKEPDGSITQYLGDVPISSNGSEGGVITLKLGQVQQVSNHSGLLLDNSALGQQHQRVMSDYEGIVPETVYDAVEFLCEQYDLTLDECRVMYMLQGRVKAEVLEPYQQYYKVIVIPMATVPTNAVLEVYSSTDPMYEDELFYTVRGTIGTMYYVDADATNGFDPETAIYGEATSSSGSYTILKAFHNCYLNRNGSKQHWLPMHCNVTFNPSIIISYYDDVEFLTV